MNIKLYEIQQEYKVLTEQLIENGGELTPEIEQALELNKNNLEMKGQSYGFVVKSLEYEIDVIDAEIARLTALKKPRVKTIDRLKETLSQAMQTFDIIEIKTPLMKINFRKSESVDVEDLALLEPNFIVTKEVKTADKTAIKEAIKWGETVSGATLQINQNLQIK